jgi:putative MFS transporter
MFAFALAQKSWQIILLTCCVNAASQVMYAAIYTYTPEVFPSQIRASGVGIASAFAKTSGVVAPFIGGWLLSVSWTFPLFLSFGFMSISAISMALLPIETRGIKLT